jgi:hypothetical protein
MDTNPNLVPTAKPMQTLAQAQTATSMPKQTLAPAVPVGKTCKHCQNPITENVYFCPNCGKKIKEPPFKLTIPAFLGIMFLSIFLTPLGLIPGFKYLKLKEPRAKIFGISVILITLLFTFLMLYTFRLFMNQMSATYYNISAPGAKTQNTPASILDQLNALQNMGR